ncbi:uncharacterized protein EAE97_003273 [Botrytis byssoidea]|uniref:Uncharacterized protein n=1 Tax=Botrytis byssoidea TaxID=139641 RepID=A0A9P5IUG9_9HELO|nr:uncharacterized protein EAE97_003273 [Botrytis byssoidea]KAF7949764.1 hypothetical protein EAE97_003273 [Botrytis byssoidea]
MEDGPIVSQNIMGLVYVDASRGEEIRCQLERLRGDNQYISFKKFGHRIRHDAGSGEFQFFRLDLSSKPANYSTQAI